MTPCKQILSFCSLIFLLSSCGGGDENLHLAKDTRASDPKAQKTFNEAMAAEKAGKFDRALKRYREISVQYPLYMGAHEAAYRRGRLLERDGQPIKAFDAYNDVLTKYPASPHYAESLSRQEKIAHGAANGEITNSTFKIKSRIPVKDTVRMLTNLRDNAPRSASAERAQFALGRLHQKEGNDTANSTRAIEAYRKLTRDYPDSPYAPLAQLQIGKILLAAAKKGNQDTANLDRAKQAFDDLLIRYPDSKEVKVAKIELAKLGRGEIERTYNIAEFYRKKGEISSALFYYQETVNRSSQGPLRAKAQGWINQLRKP